MNKVYVFLKEEDWFYDDKYSYVSVFDSLESAKEYFEVFLEVMLRELEEDYGESDEPFMDVVEINRYKEDSMITIYMEDSYYIRLSIEEHDVMSMK